MEYKEIDNRYTLLAEESCCLSCGGAIDYSKASEGEVCLDLGSGRGTDVIRMAEQVGPKGFVYGIDIADGMLRKAISTAGKLGIDNVSFQKAALENIPIKDKSIDLVISNCTINHASDKQQVWMEIARILKNNGRFVVSDIYSLEPVPAEFRTDPAAVAECWAGAVTREEYMKQLEIAGFSDIEVFDESKPYSKGKVEVASFTIRGRISRNCCC